MRHDPPSLRRLATAVGAFTAVLVSAGLACASAPPATPAPSPAAVGPLKVTDVTSSSTMPRFRHYRFDAANVSDDDPKTCWQPKVADPYGSWLRFTLAEEAEVTGLSIHNGFQLKDALGDLFALNGRLTRAWVVFDDGPGELLSLAPKKRGAQEVRFARPHRTRTVTLVVADATEGEKWPHLALSEVAVLGRAAGSAAARPKAAGVCAKPVWPAVQRALITACAGACTPAHYDAVLLCRDPRTGRAIAPVEAELGADRVHLLYDGAAEMLLDLARKGGRWEVEELMTGSDDDEN